MADKAHEQTDELLNVMEAHLQEIYEEAHQDVQKKADAYFAAYQEKDDAKRELVEHGKLSEEEYAAWRQGQIAQGRHWANLVDNLALDLENVNKIALAYINGQLPEVYAINYNGLAEVFDGLVRGYTWDLVNADVIRNLAMKDETLLPYKYLDGKKDVRWNTKVINSQVMQGILQGESIPKIAARMQNVTEMNRKSAVRNARTTVTSAENKGRQDGYERAAKDGIRMQREWIAAIDGRTRHAHRMLDGKLAEVDKPFKSEFGDIMYPGDPSAHPANVYNCRCTLGVKVIGFDQISNNTKGLTRVDFNAIIESGEMNRKTENQGDFSILPERMSKKHVRRVAKEAGIDIKGLSFTIEKNPELIKIPYTGRADTTNIGNITLMPNAFKDRETLIRTIHHEKTHVEQFKKHGSEFVQNHRSRFETEAYRLEEEFIGQLKKEGVV